MITYFVIREDGERLLSVHEKRQAVNSARAIAKAQKIVCLVTQTIIKVTPPNNEPCVEHLISGEK